MKEKELYKKSTKAQTDTEHKVLKQGGYTIHYYLTGDPGNPPLVFLHPAFADHRCFDKQIDYFSDKFRVISLDMMGHGLSKVRRSKDKIDQSVHHIERILHSEGYEKAHLAGVSMGSLIAQYFALNFAGMVLSLTSVGAYNINSDNREVLKAQRVENFKWIWKAMVSMKTFRWYVASVSVRRIEEKIRYYEMAQLFTRRSFSVMSGLGKILQKRDDIIKQYPILILSGEHDTELAQKVSKKWHESESGSEFHIIPNAGHCANMDKSEDFNRILMDFLMKDQKSK